MKFTRWHDQIRRLFGHDVWSLGLVEQSAVDIVRNGLTAPVRWLAPPVWTFLADPFVLPEPDGGWRLFAERMSYIHGKADIWSGRLNPARGRRWVDLKPLLSADAHMSFPFAFEVDGRRYLLCETWEAGAASLYVEDGGSWRFDTMLTPDGATMVDAALHHDGERWWMFCCHPGRRPMANLYVYHAPHPRGPWTPHPLNPVVRRAASARPAGPLFRDGAALIRPAQDCSATYGGALVFNRVVELSPTAYREEVVRRIGPVQPYGLGLHAICPAGEVTIIDGRRWRMHPLDPLRKLIFGGRAGQRRAELRRLWPVKPSA
ncbi:MAG TPA: hypothetical protein VK196_05860 [Magnetospirillum sp.]|nr:hypothetical protein [Magnetospirillum sp.]